MKPTVTDSTLVSLAMLSVNRDDLKQDYVHYFVPFAHRALDGLGQHPITEQLLRDKLLERFGLKLPASACNLILQRLALGKILTRENDIYRLTAIYAPGDFDTRQIKAQQCINNLLSSLVEYSAPRLKEPLSHETATVTLGAFLHRFSIDFLRFATQNTALPDVQSVNDVHMVLVGSFITDAFEKNKSLFEDLVLVVKGHMLANALLCPDIDVGSNSFRGVSFFFDTPLILCALDLQEPARCDSVRELLALLKRLHGAIGVFSHTVDEVSNVLSGAIDSYDMPGTRSRIVIAAKRSGRRKSDLLRIHSQLADKMALLGLLPVPTPKYSATFQIDESVLEQALEEDVSYYNPDSVTRDVNSVRSIYVYRRGRAPHRLEDCGSVFVTSNAAFARAAWSHGAEHESSRNVSPVITDFALANLAWLKSPLDSPNVPRLELLASCYAAMAPKEELWRKYIHEVDRLKDSGEITPSDHAVLRTHLAAHETLVYLTSGADEAFEGATVFEILDRIKAGLVAEKNSEIKSLSGQVRTSEDKVALLTAQQERIDLRLYRISHWLSYIPDSLIVSAFLVALIANSGMFDSIHFRSHIFGMFFISAFSVGAFLNFISTFNGFTVTDWLRKMHTRLTKRIHAVLRRLIGLN